MLDSQPIGTGSRVSKGLVLMASHVFEKIRGKNKVTIQFRDYDQMNATVLYDIPLDVSNAVRDNCDLDYALVRFEKPASGDIEEYNRQLSKLVILSNMSPTEKRTLIGRHVNVYSYFNGSFHCSIRENKCISLEDSDNRPYLFYYTTDTSHGSSGAPVFNDQWEIVGIHRGSREDDGGRCQANVGTLISYILEDLYGKQFGPKSPFEIRMKDYKDAGDDLGFPFQSARKKLYERKAF